MIAFGKIVVASFVLTLITSTVTLAAPPVAKMTLPSPPFASTPTPVLSWSWSATNPLDLGSAGGGAGAGKVVLHDLVLTRNTDSQSALLFQTLATGAHFDDVVLATDSVTVTLKSVFITGYKSDLGEGDKAPTDTVTMTYGAILFTAR